MILGIRDMSLTCLLSSLDNLLQVPLLYLCLADSVERSCTQVARKSLARQIAAAEAPLSGVCLGDPSDLNPLRAVLEQMTAELYERKQVGCRPHIYCFCIWATEP